MNLKPLLLVLQIILVNVIAAQTGPLVPRIQKAVYFDQSPPLRDIVQMPPQKYDGSWKDGVIRNYFHTELDQTVSVSAPWKKDPSIQDFNGSLTSDTTIVNFDASGNQGGYVPPDTHGEVGLHHFFQVVNCSYSIFNKSGYRIFGPYSNSSVWSGMPNNSNDGDAVVLYDEQANRWFFAQFSLPSGSANPPFFIMIAVSQTPDPMGSWYRYQYTFSTMPDYPKFGIWPDGYYMSTNNFLGGWVGNGVSAFDRAAMLAGNPEAAMVSFTLSPGVDGFSSLLPADCDGTFPVYGTPNYFSFIKTSPVQNLGIYEFHVDWTNPGNSTFGNKIYLPVNAFTTIGGYGNGIPQLDTDKKLDPLGDRLMFRQQYRKFNGYGSIVLNHTIETNPGVGGIRWYELRNTGTGWSIYQQGTYAPADGHSRWMGSIAQDTAGTIAMGYSVSSAAMHPAIRYTGRLKTDPLNQMTIAERTIVQGGGSQTGVWSGRSRWGDYSAISIDPAAPTTFWYTNEYYPTSSSSSWQTRAASFTFGNVFSSAASATPAMVCTNLADSIQLNAYGYGGTGTYSYSWTSIPPGFTSSLKSPKVKPSQSMQYVSAVTNNSVTRHDTVDVKIIPVPTASAGNDTTVCWYTSPVQLNAWATNYNKCAWATSGDGYFTNPASPETDYVPGIYDKTSGSVYLRMIVTPNVPCQNIINSSVIITLDPCTGIPDKTSSAASIVVRPNPAREKAFISISGLAADAVLDISSGEGISVHSEPVRVETSGTITKEIDLSRFRKGVYIIRIGNSATTLTTKLVVQ